MSTGFLKKNNIFLAKNKNPSEKGFLGEFLL